MPEYNCLDCAACCKVFGIVESEGSSMHEYTMDHGLGYLTMQIKWDGSCICLLSDNRCLIYDDRPSVCRTLTPGSYWCEYAREQMIHHNLLKDMIK
jgi:Fe-S-cluster containining protein